MTLKATLSAIFLRLKQAARLLLKPVSASPLFFITATLSGAFAPWFYAIHSASRIIRLILFATIQSATAAYLICILSTLIISENIKRVVKGSYLTFLIICAISELCSIIFTGEVINSDTIGLLQETNQSEINGFISQYITAKGILSIIAATAVCVMLTATIYRLIRLIPRGEFVKLSAAAILSATISGGAIRYATMAKGLLISDYQTFSLWVSQDPGNPVLIRTNQFKFSDSLLKWTYLIKNQIIQREGIDRWEETQATVLANPDKPSSSKDFNIAIIIGESFIQSHSSLYGYYLPTSPLLEAEKDAGRLVVYTNIIATANFTTASLRNLLNLNDILSGEQWYEAPYFPLLLKQAGWVSCHFDNQTISAGTDIGLGRMIFSDFNLKNTYDAISDSLFQYDGDYVNYVSRKLDSINTSSKKFVTYHIWGQHFDCRDRFPGNPRFTAADITVNRPGLTDKDRQRIADYDNATLYNDSVISEIINYWRDTPTLLFYFSDHGEDIPDQAPVAARNHPMPDDRDWLDRQYKIPFLVWMSDKFIEANPQIVKKIVSSRNCSGMLDNFGQAVLGLTETSTPYYNASRDITSSSYKPVKRVTSEGYQFD